MTRVLIILVMAIGIDAAIFILWWGLGGWGIILTCLALIAYACLIVTPREDQ